MQIKIEIDVKPEELRRFLGLPDVAGLQEDLIHFLRDKLGAASENFDPASFVKDNLDTLRKSSAWQKIVSAAKVGTNVVTPAPVRKVVKAARPAQEAAPAKPRRKRAVKPKAPVVSDEG